MPNYERDMSKQYAEQLRVELLGSMGSSNANNTAHLEANDIGSVYEDDDDEMSEENEENAPLKLKRKRGAKAHIQAPIHAPTIGTNEAGPSTGKRIRSSSAGGKVKTSKKDSKRKGKENVNANLPKASKDKGKGKAKAD